MTFKQFLKDTRIDLANLMLIKLGNPNSELDQAEFEISPKEFLQFAKEDFHSKSKKGRVNALTNSKRAIDCQIDVIFNKLGINWPKPPEELKPFIDMCVPKSDLPYKLQIIQSLDLAPGFIISKARTLRNKLEHSYQAPTDQDVQESLDIADLFIRSVDGKTRILHSTFALQDRKENCVCIITIHFSEKSKHFDLHHRSSSIDNNSGTDISVQVENNCSEYFGLLRLMNSVHDQFESENSIKLIAKLIGHQIPHDKIRLELGN